MDERDEDQLAERIARLFIEQSLRSIHEKRKQKADKND